LENKTFFTKTLLDWHKYNARELPWKNTRDPYTIWISEVILQQTRVEQGTPYFYKFIQSFPDIFSLAAASEEEVLACWQGLGYYSRARNLHHTAKTITFEMQGIFPEKYEDILRLKGIGTYTAAAIVSFAFDQPVPVVDGNVIRVLCRYFGIEEPVDRDSVRKQINKLAAELIHLKRPADYNQAIMDFGATLCKPKLPECDSCPFQHNCQARMIHKVTDIPVKEKKIFRKNRYLHYFFMVVDDQYFVIQKREDSDIWANMYEFPLIECNSDIPPSAAEINAFISDISGQDLSISDWQDHKISSEKHVLTHRDLYINYYVHEVDSAIKSLKNKYILVNSKKVSNFAVPKPIEKFLKKWNDHKKWSIFE
jgi:A/G-specific adenine glycosylase